MNFIRSRQRPAHTLCLTREGERRAQPAGEHAVLINSCRPRHLLPPASTPFCRHGLLQRNQSPRLRPTLWPSLLWTGQFREAWVTFRRPTCTINIVSGSSGFSSVALRCWLQPEPLVPGVRLGCAWDALPWLILWLRASPRSCVTSLERPLLTIPSKRMSSHPVSSPCFFTSSTFQSPDHLLSHALVCPVPERLRSGQAAAWVCVPGSYRTPRLQGRVWPAAGGSVPMGRMSEL